VLRLAFLTEKLSIDAGELTDKGVLNQRHILRRHSALVEQLYADPPRRPQRSKRIAAAEFGDIALSISILRKLRGPGARSRKVGTGFRKRSRARRELGAER
jgi:hypothetical protein